LDEGIGDAVRWKVDKGRKMVGDPLIVDLREQFHFTDLSIVHEDIRGILLDGAPVCR
jgi:hypothetical protein